MTPMIEMAAWFTLGVILGTVVFTTAFVVLARVLWHIFR